MIGIYDDFFAWTRSKAQKVDFWDRSRAVLDPTPVPVVLGLVPPLKPLQTAQNRSGPVSSALLARTGLCQSWCHLPDCFLQGTRVSGPDRVPSPGACAPTSLFLGPLPFQLDGKPAHAVIDGRAAIFLTFPLILVEDPWIYSARESNTSIQTAPDWSHSPGPCRRPVQGNCPGAVSGGPVSGRPRERRPLPGQLEVTRARSGN